MIQIILIALISLFAQFFFPWWSIALVAFGISFWQGKGGAGAFVHGFVGIAVVWLTYACLIHFQTAGVFTGRMGLLILKSQSPLAILLLTPVLGGLVGGFASMAGYFSRQAIRSLQQFAPKRA